MTKSWQALCVVAAMAVAAPIALAAGSSSPEAVCGLEEEGVQCGPGNDRQTAGGGDTGNVPHSDGAGRNWPKISGVLWKVLDSGDRRKEGGPDNDELLGHHGDETLIGGKGDDVLWGDWDPKNNTTRQRDVLSGGQGNDWLYPSHGKSTVRGGPGKDYVWAFYGKGTIDCGPGKDTARIRTTGAFETRNCETIQNFCAFGSNGRGGCRKPGERRRR